MAMLSTSEPRGGTENGRHVRAVTNDSEKGYLSESKALLPYKHPTDMYRLWDPGYSMESGSEGHSGKPMTIRLTPESSTS